MAIIAAQRNIHHSEVHALIKFLYQYLAFCYEGVSMGIPDRDDDLHCEGEKAPLFMPKEVLSAQDSTSVTR